MQSPEHLLQHQQHHLQQQQHAQQQQQQQNQKWATLRRERAKLVQDSNRRLNPRGRANDGPTAAQNLWNTALSGTMPSHRSSPMLTSGGYWGSTKTLHEGLDPISLPQTPTIGSVGILPGDPEPIRRRESSGDHQHKLTPEGLSWKRLHMSRAKLKATATTSELLSGFAMVAMVELQINTPTNVPDWLFVLFTVCTTVLVSLHIFALMISTYILPNVDAVSKMQHLATPSKGGYSKLGGEEEDHSSSMGNILESPHERMRNFIELAWAISTVLGLFLFLVELAILCWVKFWDYSFTAAWAGTVVIVPALVLFVVFVAHFYRSLVEQKVVATTSDLDNLEAIRSTLRDVEAPNDGRSGDSADVRWGHHGLRHRASTQNKTRSTEGDRGSSIGVEDGQRTERSHAGGDGIGVYTRETLSWRRLHTNRAKMKETLVSSTLLCGFALECMVELQVQAPTGCPDWLFSLFAVNTTVLISVHVIAAMISTFIMPSIDCVCAEQEEWEESGLDPSLWGVKPSESPHELLRGFIEMAWIFSSVAGLFLFLTELALLSWVKFWDVSIPAAAYGSIAVAPFFLLCVAFCYRFHSILAGHSYEVRALGLRQVEEMKERLDAANSSFA